MKYAPLTACQFLRRSENPLQVFFGRGPMAPPLTILRVKQSLTREPLMKNHCSWHLIYMKIGMGTLNDTKNTVQK